MTVKEKREALERYCEDYFGKNSCVGCPLYENYPHDRPCSNGDDEIIEENYRTIFGNEDDKVNHPDHYTNGDIECIDAMVAAYGKENVATYCIINSFKYIWRSEYKNGIEDIKKAIWYLNKHVELKEDIYEEAV